VAEQQNKDCFIVLINLYRNNYSFPTPEHRL